MALLRTPVSIASRTVAASDSVDCDLLLTKGSNERRHAAQAYRLEGERTHAIVCEPSRRCGPMCSKHKRRRRLGLRLNAGAKLVAAKVLLSVLDTLRRGSAQQRRGGLALVRTMTEKGGA
jgi:hypothetical protein